MAGGPVDSLLMSLVEKEIPEGRIALLESHKNLKELAGYCKENYVNSEDKSKALQETKNFASQSLASVAYQIHSLAVNILQMMDQQTIQLQNMQSNANNIGLLVDIHKEKVARREIGTLTSSKNFSRAHKVVPPAEPEKTHKYKREDIDYSSLDNVGHGVKSARKDDPSERRSSQSSSSGSLKENSTSSILSSSQGSIHGLPGSIYATISSDKKGAFGNTMPPPHRPPVAPVAPFKAKTAPVHTTAPVAPSTPTTATTVEPLSPSTEPIPEPPVLYEEVSTIVPPPPPPPPPPGLEGLYQVPPNNMPALNVDDDLPPPMPTTDADDLPPIPTGFVDELPPPPPDHEGGEAADEQNVYDVLPPAVMPPPPPPPPPPPMGVAPMVMSDSHVIPENYEEKVVAIYDYQKLRDDELELLEGDVIYVIKKNEDGWFEGIKDGVQGLFPGNYVTPYM